ncbi:hypothetical protein HOK51_03165 [Candidatus Woesearchaeota archaeon]|jgi:hypothetical protein|nr:hypothetical protein [Candidatus Woesearchaeota archaeon]MBT6518819.1 hypothetical protein [Candidatus Woesearchaeota archaeon]MBT7367958.1 hypothetical protein [Candidatus Woesearchaeota archaeon]
MNSMDNIHHIDYKIEEIKRTAKETAKRKYSPRYWLSQRKIINRKIDEIVDAYNEDLKEMHPLPARRIANLRDRMDAISRITKRVSKKFKNNKQLEKILDLTAKISTESHKEYAFLVAAEHMLTKKTKNTLNDFLELTEKYATDISTAMAMGIVESNRIENATPNKIIERYNSKEFKEMITGLHAANKKDLIQYSAKLKNQSEFLPKDVIEIITKYKNNMQIVTTLFSSFIKAELNDFSSSKQIICELNSERFRKLIPEEKLLSKEYNPTLDGITSCIISGITSADINTPYIIEETYRSLESQKDFYTRGMVCLAINILSVVGTDILQRTLNIFSDKTKPNLEIAEQIREIYNIQFSTKPIEAILDFADNLEHDEDVFSEFMDYFKKKYEEYIKEKRPEEIVPDAYLLLQYANWTTNEINQLSKETAAPITIIKSNVQGKYRPKIHALTEQEKRKISRAYNIAANNINENTGNDYSKEFYIGLCDTLDEDYEHLIDWCETIIGGLKKVAETGKSLSEVIENG